MPFTVTTVFCLQAGGTTLCWRWRLPQCPALTALPCPATSRRCSKHPLASVRQTAEALHTASVQFRRRVGRPFVLVIDSADRLARNEESDNVLGAMLAYARDWAQASRLQA